MLGVCVIYKKNMFQFTAHFYTTISWTAVRLTELSQFLNTAKNADFSTINSIHGVFSVPKNRQAQYDNPIKSIYKPLNFKMHHNTNVTRLTFRSTVAVLSPSSGLMSDISVSESSASSCWRRGFTGGTCCLRDNWGVNWRRLVLS
jgi:hypothetical protein